MYKCLIEAGRLEYALLVLKVLKLSFLLLMIDREIFLLQPKILSADPFIYLID
jgi:hypothetical protein